jgi:NADPH2:quinone reductase
MEKAQWGGAIDNVGGETLTWLTRTLRPWGSIASIGLVGGIELNTTVMPFILRGVSLLGINSVILSHEQRTAIWQRIATDLKPSHLDKIVTGEVAFEDMPSSFDQYIEGRVTGRTIVNIGA